MAQEKFQVENYALSVLPRNNFHYYIKMDGEGHNCQCYFRPDSESLPLTRKVRDKQYIAYYHESQYANLVDLLRNEKPLYFSFHVIGSRDYSGLSTNEEPVGEAE